MEKINITPQSLGLPSAQPAVSSQPSSPSSEDVSADLAHFNTWREGSGYEPCPYGKCSGSGLIHGERDGNAFAKSCQCLKDRSKLRFLGERFYRITLGEIVPRNASQGHLKAILLDKPNTGIFLFGKGGAGKTHFLAAMYNFWEQKGKRIKYLEDSMLKDELRNAELNNDNSFVVDMVNDHDCIFIDDVGKAAMSAFHKAALYRFFNEAYKQKKQIFITSNDPLKVLGGDDYWGAHAARRVEDLCQLVEF